MTKTDPKTMIKAFKKLFLYLLKRYKLQMIFVVFGIILSALATAMGTLLVKEITNTILDIKAGKIGLERLGMGIATIASIYLVGVIGSFIQTRLLLNISTGIMRSLRDEMFEHMQLIPVQYFTEHVNGETMSLYTNDTEALREMLNTSIAQMISSVMMIVAVLTVMIIMSPILSAVVVIIVVAMVLTITKLTKKGHRFFAVQQEKLSKTNGYIEEYSEGQKVVKIFCHEEKVKSDFSKINEELRAASASANMFSNIVMPVMNNFSFIAYALAAMIGGVLLLNGLLGGSTTEGVSIMVGFLPATRLFSMPLSQLGQQFNYVLTALAATTRIFDFLDVPAEKDAGYVTLVNAKIDGNGVITPTDEKTGRWAWEHPHGDGSITYTELKGEICFEDVTFSYDGKQTVLNDVSLYAKPGQKIALVGSTGAGKTTITNLINRFYDVPEGKIRYDGININKIKKADLRRSLGMVLQDTHLFTASVKENIRFGRLDATDEDVYEAGRLSNAESFIMHLPEGYDTMLTSDGANLSQGQRQLLNIARAAIANPPVLILDEATSSVDTRTEKIIVEGMDKLMNGRTVFVIAHRLSTIKNAEAILVLENGEIIERGNHDELIKQKGRYYNLYMGLLELA
ncbi:MAG: ABC transporter ATP-binding protein/permease [Christensenellaceae bacterium]|jgi:ATP-binding cassette subfamily B protein|nr:ABC transporter ATP-binding protein/permease [Christensenellaceae bacterium]